MVRSEILEQIFNRVVTKATSPVTHYLGNKFSLILLQPVSTFVVIKSSLKCTSIYSVDI